MPGCVHCCSPQPFARTENVQTLNPSTFESETRADNEDQISFISICSPKAERGYIFDSSRNTRKTCMISGSPTLNKKSKVWEAVSCVSIPLVHPLYYTLTSPNILAVCRDSRLFCASFTVGCQKGEIPALRALSWRILFCNSPSKAKPVSSPLCRSPAGFSGFLRFFCLSLLIRLAGAFSLPVSPSL